MKILKEYEANSNTIIQSKIILSYTFYHNFYKYNTIFTGSANTFGKHQNQLLIQNKDSERKLMIDAFV